MRTINTRNAGDDLTALYATYKSLAKWKKQAQEHDSESHYRNPREAFSSHRPSRLTPALSSVKTAPC